MTMSAAKRWRRSLEIVTALPVLVALPGRRSSRSRGGRRPASSTRRARSADETLATREIEAVSAGFRLRESFETAVVEIALDAGPVGGCRGAIAREQLAVRIDRAEEPQRALGREDIAPDAAI